MDETTLTRTLRDLAAGTPVHTAPVADARARAHRLQRQHRLAASAAVVVVAAGAFGVRGLAGGSPHPPAAATEHVLTIQQVTYEAECNPTLPTLLREVKSADGTACYVLDPAALVIHPQSADALYDTTQGYLVQVNLDDPDRVAFAALTAKVVPLTPPHNQLAIVLDGVVLSSPVIESAIDGGTFQITGGDGTPFTKADVDKLAAELMG